MAAAAPMARAAFRDLPFVVIHRVCDFLAPCTKETAALAGASRACGWIAVDDGFFPLQTDVSALLSVDGCDHVEAVGVGEPCSVAGVPGEDGVPAPPILRDRAQAGRALRAGEQFERVGRGEHLERVKRGERFKRRRERQEERAEHFKRGEQGEHFERADTH